MQLMIEQRGLCAVIMVWTERLTKDNVEIFLDQIEPILSECAHVIIDLHKVIDIDSQGVGSLLTCRHRLNKRGAKLTLRQGREDRNIFSDLFQRAGIFAEEETPCSIVV